VDTRPPGAAFYKNGYPPLDTTFLLPTLPPLRNKRPQKRNNVDSRYRCVQQ